MSLNVCNPNNLKLITETTLKKIFSKTPNQIKTDQNYFSND